MRLLVVLLIVAVTGWSATARSETRELRDLFLNDNGKVRPYVDVVQPAGSGESAWGVPLPWPFISVANFQNSQQWMRGFDFDRDGRLTLAEVTQGWLVRVAHWRTGIPFKATDLMAAPAGSKGGVDLLHALRGVRISIAAERAVRATVNAMADRGSPIRDEVRLTLHAISEAVLDRGGDGGAGGPGEREGRNDDDSDRD